MGNKSKILGSLLVLLFIIGVMLIPSITNGQLTSYYTTTRDYNQVAFTLTTFQPIDSITYSKTLPLEFHLIWNISLESLLDTHMPVKGYAYTIDNNTLVNIAPNGSLAVPIKESYWFSYSVDISNLTQGNHKLSVIAYQYYNNSNYQGLFNQSSTPITFSVNNTLPATTPAPTTTVPELSWLVFVPLLVSLFAVAVVLRHRKTTIAQNP
jgi:hypothetical protein